MDETLVYAALLLPRRRGSWGGWVTGAVRELQRLVCWGMAYAIPPGRLQGWTVTCVLATPLRHDVYEFKHIKEKKNLG